MLVRLLWFYNVLTIHVHLNLQDLANLDIATVRNLREAAVMTLVSHKNDNSPNKFVATRNKNSVDLSSLPGEPFGE